MSDLVQVHAFLPRPLKCRAFIVLALQERKFSHWLREALEGWLQEVEGGESSDIQLAGSQTHVEEAHEHV